MRRNIIIPIGLAVSFLFAPSLLCAQQRAAVASAPMAVPVRAMPMTTPMSAGHVFVHPGTAAATRPTNRVLAANTYPGPPRITGHPTAPRVPARNYPTHSTQYFNNGTYGTRPPVAEDDNGVPGLGFDYVHYAATHPRAGRHRFQGGAIFPFVGGGIYLPTAGYFEPGATEPAADAQQNETADLTAESSGATPVEESPAARSLRSRPNSAPAQAPEYIFVRRDGTVFFAVAYSWVNGNLQYVTQDGFRKLVSTTTLDLDATSQFNEQRGVSFRSPA